jgi:hypothetical protein
MALQRAYISLTDVLTMLGRPRESAGLAETALEAMRGYGVDNPVLVANQVEALLAIGDWDEADRISAAALRAITGSYPYMLLIIRADVEIGRGGFDAARAHLETASATLREDRGLGLYDASLAELALWERRWTDADAAIDNGLAQARSTEAAQIRVQLCAKGLRTQAELAVLARARRDADALRDRLDRAQQLLDGARRAAAEAAAITPNSAGWHALARAEYERASGSGGPEVWADAATTWERLERPPIAAYCRWRQAEALVAAGASRAEASAPLRDAHAIAARIGANPLTRELRLLAQRARLDLAPPETGSPDGKPALEEILGLTPREADVWPSSPAATPTARSPRHWSSASRPPASMSRTSCISSTRPAGAKRPPSRTASPRRTSIGPEFPCPAQILGLSVTLSPAAPGGFGKADYEIRRAGPHHAGRAGAAAGAGAIRCHAGNRTGQAVFGAAR